MQYLINALCTGFVLLALTPLQALADKFIPADDQRLQYVGRIDHSQAKKPYLTWPGSAINFTITGKRLVLTLDDDRGLNYYNVIFNGKDTYPLVLSAQKGQHDYDLSYMLDSAQTSVTVFKRTEGEEGGSRFLGIKIGDREKLLAPPVRKPRKIAFFGDSITVGMGNEGAHNGKDDNPAEKNHYLSYASITSRALNAEAHSIAKSGIGFMISWFDFIMPEYYDQLTAQNNNDTQWDFTQFQPDVVVVNLGQNDSWLIDDQKRLEASPEQIIAAYKQFLLTLVEKHPNAYFVCAIGSMDATADQVWPSYIAQGVAQIKNANPALKHRIDTIQFEFTGYGAHPRVEQHMKNADKLTQFIRTKMNW